MNLYINCISNFRSCSFPALWYYLKSSAEQWSHGCNWHASWSIRSFGHCWQACNSTSCSCRFTFPGLMSFKMLLFAFRNVIYIHSGNWLSFLFALLIWYLILCCDLYNYTFLCYLAFWYTAEVFTTNLQFSGWAWPW